MRELVGSASVDLFPFYRQINSSSWEGGLYSTNRKYFLPSATSEVPQRRISLATKFWGLTLRSPSKKVAD